MMSPVSFSPKGEMYLEVNESDAEPIEKAMILKEPLQEETHLETTFAAGCPYGTLGSF